MNIPIDQIKALRATVELGAKGVTSLPLEEIPPALREVIEQGSREINSLVNVLILLENPGIAKELEDLTEQCGVNTSSTFNTPPKEAPPAPGKTQTPDPKLTPKPPGELDPEVWKCNEPKADTLMPDPKREEMAQVVITHIAPMLDQLEEDEEEPKADTLMPDPAGSANRQLAKQLAEEADKQLAEEAEPREATPVEVLIDKIMGRELPDSWERLAKDAQEFLDYQVSRKFFMQVAILHELGHILIQWMDDNDVKEVVTEFSAKLTRIVEGKTD